MDLIFKGTQEEIEKFVNEIIYPVVYERQHETDGHYFRFTDDKGDYQSRKSDNVVVRRIRGYFPGFYYKVDYYADKYKEVAEDGLAKGEEMRGDVIKHYKEEWELVKVEIDQAKDETKRERILKYARSLSMFVASVYGVDIEKV